MTDALSRYHAALVHANEARAVVYRHAKLISAVGQQLAAKPLQLLCENSGQAFPASLLGGRETLSVDVREWPDGETLAKALAELHAAQGAAERAYRELPETIRETVKAPG